MVHDFTLGMKEYDMEKYWNKRAEYFEKDAFKAVCICEADKRVNKMYDALQRHLLFRLLKRCTNVTTVLEIGCGIGRWALSLQHHGIHYTGIDISPKMVEIAKKRVSAAFFTMSADALTFEDEQFDLVVSVTVLQHIPYEQQHTAITQLCRVTKKGGYILLIEDTKSPEKTFNLFSHARTTWETLFVTKGCSLVYSVNHKCRLTAAFFQWISIRIQLNRAIKVSLLLEGIFSLFLPEKYFQGVGIVVKK